MSAHAHCVAGATREYVAEYQREYIRRWYAANPDKYAEHNERMKERYAAMSPEMRAFVGARSRCSSKTEPTVSKYRNRGIRFLFTSFEQWFAELGPRPTAEHSVDRINNDGNYEVGNVRWATKKEQRANQRVYQARNQYTKGATCHSISQF